MVRLSRRNDRENGGAIRDSAGRFAEVLVEADTDIPECCMCGYLLDGDAEDELNGEGPGRHVCGACNRTKNFEAFEMGF